MTFSRFCTTVILIIGACLCPLTGRAQAVERAQVEKEIDALWAQIKAKEPLLFEVAAEDKERYAEFLQQPETGIIRLLPRERFEEKLRLRGGGAYYSFTRLTHEYGRGSDISLEQGRFGVGFAGLNFGFLTELGKLPLAEVTLEHPALNFLLKFNPPLTEPEIRTQQRQAMVGLQVGEFNYKAGVTAKVEQTYVLRSIDYDTSDVLVALQVVRQDDDGSLILLWKMLKKFTAPKPERPKQH